MEAEQMKQLISLDTFDLLLRWMAIFGLPTGIVLGLIWMKRFAHPRKWQLGLITGAFCGFLFPFVYAVWRFYLWRIRIDLDQNFVGLHRTDVLAGNLLIFTAIGIAVGIGIRIYIRWLKKQLAT